MSKLIKVNEKTLRMEPVSEIYDRNECYYLYKYGNDSREFCLCINNRNNLSGNCTHDKYTTCPHFKKER